MIQTLLITLLNCNVYHNIWLNASLMSVACSSILQYICQAEGQSDFLISTPSTKVANANHNETVVGYQVVYPVVIKK